MANCVATLCRVVRNISLQTDRYNQEMDNQQQWQENNKFQSGNMYGERNGPATGIHDRAPAGLLMPYWFHVCYIETLPSTTLTRLSLATLSRTEKRLEGTRADLAMELNQAEGG